MHPAYSVILFTTASGAGYGLLFWLAILSVFGGLPAGRTLGAVGLALAFALVVLGLLSSTAHLGRPERAWRAVSQWRSSWLSREGVAAIAAFVPFGLFAIGWLDQGSIGGVWTLAALGAALMALVTVFCTGMIYQSLPTIRNWSQPLVTPVYLSLSLCTGAVLALLLLRILGHESEFFGWLTVLLLAAALQLKRAYWAAIDGLARELTPGDATGLKRFGRVRSLEPPHAGPNFVMREMGYTVARRHAVKLRSLVQMLGFGVPLLALILSLTVDGALAVALTLVGVIAVAFGVTVERWLFFAEAQHVVTLYYGADAA